MVTIENLYQAFSTYLEEVRLSWELAAIETPNDPRRLYAETRTYDSFCE
jgi:hypothetical protein